MSGNILALTPQVMDELGQEMYPGDLQPVDAVDFESSMDSDKKSHRLGIAIGSGLTALSLLGAGATAAEADTTTITKTVTNGSAEFHLSGAAEVVGLASGDVTVVGPAHKKKATKAVKKANKKKLVCTDKVPEKAGDKFCLKPGGDTITQEYRTTADGKIVWGTRTTTERDKIWVFNKKTGNYENWTIRPDGTICKNIMDDDDAPKHVGKHKKPKQPKHKDVGAVVEVGDAVSAALNIAIGGYALVKCADNVSTVSVNTTLSGTAEAKANARGKFDLSASDKVRVESDTAATVATRYVADGSVKCHSETTTETTVITTPEAPKPSLAGFDSINRVLINNTVDATLHLSVPVEQSVKVVFNTVNGGVIKAVNGVDGANSVIVSGSTDIQDIKAKVQAPDEIPPAGNGVPASNFEVVATLYNPSTGAAILGADGKPLTTSMNVPVYEALPDPL